MPFLKKTFKKDRAMLIDGKEVPRIRGGEIEYAFALSEKGKLLSDSALSHSGISDIFLKSIPEGLKFPHLIYAYRHFCSNGALIHVDTGYHPEYAGPEATSAEEFLYHELVGDLHMETTVRRMNEELAKDEKSAAKNTIIRAFKNNVDMQGNSYGAHESYLTLRSLIGAITSQENTIWKFICPLLITRHIFLGSGWVYMDKKGVMHYRMSQRAPHFSCLIGGGTTSGRALITTRDEPHADGEKFFRLHIIEGDSNMSETAIYLKTGMMDMLLDMLECGFLKEPPLGEATQEEVLSAHKKFAEDPTLQVKCSLAGKEFSALDIQEWHWKTARRFYRENVRLLTPEKKHLLRLWGKLIRRAKKPCPWKALAPYVDWAAELKIIEEDMRRRGYGWNDHPEKKIDFPRGKRVLKRTIFAHLKSIDLQYHELSPTGLAQVLIKHKKLKRLTSPEVLKSVLYKPFPTARPHARYEVLSWGEEEAKKLEIDLGLAADWTRISLRNDKAELIATFNLTDPWNPHMPEKELPPPPSDAPEAVPNAEDCID